MQRHGHRCSSDDDTITVLPPPRPRKPPPPPRVKRRSAPNQSKPLQDQPKTVILIKNNVLKSPTARRSSSENDVTEAESVSSNETTSTTESRCSSEQPNRGLEVDHRLILELNELFGEVLATRLCRLLTDLRVWNKALIIAEESHKILLGAATIGFKPVDLGKLNRWLSEVTTKSTPVQRRRPQNPNPSNKKKVRPGGGSLDSVLAGESGMALVESQSTHQTQTLVQHVNKRFRSEFAAVILGLLEDCMVENETDLAYVGESVMDAATSCGNLTLIQINRLSEWVDSVKRKRKGMKDPNVNRVQEQALSAQLGLAISTAFESTDLESRNKAKIRASVAMLEISQKKRHFKGLRSQDSDDFIGTRF